MITLAVSLAVTGTAANAEWDPNMEVFGSVSDDRVIGGFELLAPVWQDNNNLSFAELKAYVSDEKSQEFNVGLGHRRLNSDDSWIFGGFAHYDRRSTGNNNDFDQLTLGLEAFGTLLDGRLNYYHPFGDAKRVDGWVGGLQYEGYSIFTQESFEEALRGWDGEVGVLLPVSDSIETRLYAGAYTLDGDLNDSETGWKARLEVRPMQSLSIEVGYRDDDLFGSETLLTVRYSFGYPNTAKVRTLRERMIQPTRRDLDILVASPDITPLQSVVLQSNTINIDSRRGIPNGDGSYERPYQSVDACLAGKCSRREGSVGGEGALVRFWKGNSSETGPYAAAGSWDLRNSQILWGEGWQVNNPAPSSNPVYNISSLLAQGTPNSGLAPWFAPGGTGPGLVLANNNKVLGVGIDVSGSPALTLPTLGGDFVPGRFGIYGENATGFDIQGNLVKADQVAMVLVASNGESQGTIKDNRIILSGPTAGPVGLPIAAVFVNLADGASSRQDIDFIGNSIEIGGAADPAQTVIGIGVAALNSAWGSGAVAEQNLLIAGSRFSGPGLAHGLVAASTAGLNLGDLTSTLPDLAAGNGEGAIASQTLVVADNEFLFEVPAVQGGILDALAGARTGTTFINLATRGTDASQEIEMTGNSLSFAGTGSTGDLYAALGVSGINLALGRGATAEQSYRGSDNRITGDGLAVGVLGLNVGGAIHDPADERAASARQTFDMSGDTVSEPWLVGAFFEDVALGRLAETEQNVVLTDVTLQVPNQPLITGTPIGDIGATPLWTGQLALGSATSTQNVTVEGSNLRGHTGPVITSISLAGVTTPTLINQTVRISNTDIAVTENGLNVIGAALPGNAEFHQEVTVTGGSITATTSAANVLGIAPPGPDTSTQTVDLSGSSVTGAVNAFPLGNVVQTVLP